MGEERVAIRVFLLDDHEVVRRGVAELLEADGDIAVVGEASTAAEALARVPALRPDVAVLDVRLPDGDGVTVCRELRSQLPDLACLMLTSFADDEALFDAIMAGASGYVLKQIRGSDLLGAVRTVAAGSRCWTRGPPAQVLERLRSGHGGGAGRPAGRAHRPGARDPRPDRRGADQPADRRAAVPGREDDQELRVEPAGQARHGAPHPGGGPGQPDPPRRPPGPGVGLEGQATSVTGPSMAAVSTSPQCAHRCSIGTFSVRTSACSRVTPWARAWAARCSRR